MKIVYSDKHKLHNPELELSPGFFEPYHETPDRARFIYEAVRERGVGPFVEPSAFSMDAFLRVHDRGYLKFLETGWDEWQKTGFEKDVFAYAFNVQHPGSPVPETIGGKVGYYTADGCVPLTRTSWEAIRVSAFTALTGHKFMAEGDSAVFALCRPPGHHATSSVAAGYCFINNAALAAQAFIDSGAKRVAVLDVDYHHGNGTQDIFYNRNDVLFVSLHADPAFDYPYYRGYAAEKGAGQGEGFTVNYPLPLKTAYDTYGEALADAIETIRHKGAEALVVSLGVDAYKEDPISRFLLESEDFLRLGSAIGALGVPTLFVMEGGYAVEQVGVNVANALAGFLDSFRR